MDAIYDSFFVQTNQVTVVQSILIDTYIAFFIKEQLLRFASSLMQDKLSTAKREYYITELLKDLYRFISRSNMESLKPTPRVVFRLGGYDDMTQ